MCVSVARRWPAADEFTGITCPVQLAARITEAALLMGTLPTALKDLRRNALIVARTAGCDCCADTAATGRFGGGFDSEWLAQRIGLSSGASVRAITGRMPRSTAGPIVREST